MPEPLPEAIVTNLFSECAIYQLSYCFSPRQYGTPLSPPIVYFGQPFGRGPHLDWLRFHISHARFVITLFTIINSSCNYKSSVVFLRVSVFFWTEMKVRMIVVYGYSRSVLVHLGGRRSINRYYYYFIVL